MGSPRRLKYLDSLLPCLLDPDQFSSRYPWPCSSTPRAERIRPSHKLADIPHGRPCRPIQYCTVSTPPPSLLDAGVGRGVTPGDPVLPWIQLSTLIRGYVRSTLTYMARVGMVERLAITHNTCGILSRGSILSFSCLQLMDEPQSGRMTAVWNWRWMAGCLRTATSGQGTPRELQSAQRVAQTPLARSLRDPDRSTKRWTLNINASEFGDASRGPVTTF
jgi:hypothetical protein